MLEWKEGGRAKSEEDVHILVKKKISYLSKDEGGGGGG